MDLLITIITCIAGIFLLSLLIKFIVSMVVLGASAKAIKKAVKEDEDFWKDVK